MAWTPPRTYVTGELMTSSMFNTHIRDNLLALLPTGSYLHRAVDPNTAAELTYRSLWLYCNGVAVSRATYSALFAEIGTAFGPGDGTTTFHLPDARSRGLWAVGATHPLGSNEGAPDGGSRGADHTHGIPATEAPSATGNLSNNTTNVNTTGGMAGMGFLMFGSVWIRYRE